MEYKDRLTKAKIPGNETGIEVKQTVCGVCCSFFYCGMDVYIKDDKIIKVEGTKDHKLNKGLLCTKGLASKEYVYSERRIKTPLRRVGERGEGKFESITWDEAYKEIANRLKSTKEKHGPEAVSFYSGCEKWYRTFLRRLAYSFGSPNYGSESSTCATSAKMAWLSTAGMLGRHDIKNAKTYLGFSLNQYYSRYINALDVEAAKERGMKIIVVDPRVTPTTNKVADIHLQIKPGTDGALALGMANMLIQNGWIDKEYIDNYVHGFEEFQEYVKQFDIKTVERITGVNGQKLIQAVKLMAENLPVSIHESVAPIVHHINGMQNYRAMIALSALTGCYDKLGGNIPRKITFAYQTAGFDTMESEFIQSVKPQNVPPAVGSERFPLWEELVGEMQAVDLARQVLEEEPYPVKALVAFGMNYRMFQDDEKFIEAFKKLDFYVDVDLFMTDSAKYADIVLPACTTFERDEFKIYRGGYAIYTQPVIEPLYQSKSDVQIISELANALELDDELLRSGYDKCIEYIISNLSITLDELKTAKLPIPIIEANRYIAGGYTKKGYNTPTGKFELKSTVIEKIDKRYGLDPLPTYRESAINANAEEYPFIMFTGSRMAHAFHSRLHDVNCLRSLRQYPTADINVMDAQQLGISLGDDMLIYTEKGSITVKANPTHTILQGTLSILHDYREADVNSIIDYNHVDPYSGFPGFKSVRCKIKKCSGVV